ncbi:MAG: aminotransferase class I/II [Spirochaetales bacterium]|nr:aminotransferase class I/II [Spirochaetales bacterium]
MHDLAVQLNNILDSCVAGHLLSETGRRMYFPKGIAAQAAEAGRFAKVQNASVGMAVSDKSPMIIPALHSLAPKLNASDLVEYAPNAGDRRLRTLWKEMLVKKNPNLAGAEISNPTVVAGITNGISQIADLFIDPDDVVILPDLFWGNYRLIFDEKKQASLSTFPIFDGTHFNIDGLEEQLDLHKNKGKAAVLLNFPNNPTGYSPTHDEVREIERIVVGAADSGMHLLVVLDDAYFGLYYEDNVYDQSLFGLFAHNHENILAMKVDGPTKEDFAWGFRIGFVTFGGKGLSAQAYDALENKLLGAVRSSISSSSRPAQSLLIRTFLTPGYEDQKRVLRRQLFERYQTVKGLVRNIPSQAGIRALPFNSGYFMSFANPGKAEQLRTSLLHGRGIGTISIQGDYLRVAYSSVDLSSLPDLYEQIFKAAALNI